VLNSIRARITFWYVSVFGLLLLGFSCFIYLTLARSLYHRLDESLIDDAQVAIASLETETEENEGDSVAGASQSLRELELRNAYIAIFSGDHLLASNYPDDSRPGSISSRQFEPERSEGISLGTDKQFGTAGARLCLVTGASGGCSILLAAPLAGLKL